MHPGRLLRILLKKSEVLNVTVDRQLEEGERSEKEIMHKSLVRRAGGGISGNFHIIGYARRGSKSAKAQQKNDNFARWGQKTAQSEKFKEKAEGKVEIQ